MDSLQLNVGSVISLKQCDGVKEDGTQCTRTRHFIEPHNEWFCSLACYLSKLEDKS